MKRISLNNGHTYQTPEQAMPEIDNRNLWDVVVNAMDDDTREAVAYDLAPLLQCGVSPPRRGTYRNFTIR